MKAVEYIDQAALDELHKDVKVINITIFLTLAIFSLLIFPLIHVAYKDLDSHRIELVSSHINMIHTLGSAIALRDSDTNAHNYRVTYFSILFARALRLEEDEIRTLIKGAFLHDIGKIGISDTILLKDGRLDDSETVIMQSHVNKGVELIEENLWLQDAKEVILYHHEKYTMDGYPNNIKGTDIPRIARLFTIVDVFDALTSKRPYKEAFDHETAVRILKEGSGIHFDPGLLETFLSLSKRFYEISRQEDLREIKDELDELIEHYFYL